MNSCATHIKRIDPLTGTATVYVVATGAIEADPAVLALLGCCPERQVDKEKVCIQPIGNLDPNLVVSGWLLTATSVDSAGVVDVLSVNIWDSAIANDMTATHEITECPVSNPIDVAMCLPA